MEGRENKIVWVFFVAFIAIIVVSLLWGCKTKTVVETQVVTIRDTLITHRTDTVRDVKVTTKRDTIKQIESHTFTINNVGDTVKEIHHYHDVWHTMVKDSTNRYEARMDSLERALKVEKDKNKVVKKSGRMWWEVPLVVGIIIIVILAVMFARGKGNNGKS